MFKESFKYYKAKRPINFKFDDVIDLEDSNTIPMVYRIQTNSVLDGMTDQNVLPGMKAVHTWQCYTLPQNPGLIILRNPFTAQGQRYWMVRCLRDYPRPPNVVNMSPQLFTKSALDDWWRELQQCRDKDDARRLKIAMRWTTLGYHHDWDTKVYNEQKRTEFPDDLSKLCNFFAEVLGFKGFTAQAAIVNYYPIGTTLAGHTDHSEVNLKAPLFSFSFGQTAIFLIGGKTKDVKPTALFLKSGDVLVMSEESRLCYHAVPRVMKACVESWNEDISTEYNTNSQDIIAPVVKKPRIDHKQIICRSDIDMLLYDRVADELFWTPFKNYMNDSRININVRQVLNAGDSQLP